MQTKRIHYGLTALSFLVPLITYSITMQPSIPFWDCGEFIGAAAQLGISHPPGAPLWILAGHVGTMFLPFISDPGARYNFMSVLCSATSIMLLYLIAVRVIKIWRGEPQSMGDVITHYGGAFIAALCFTWSDSVWFNSNEFIVFSPGLLFIMLILWLGMIWHERANEPHSERYLMLIFYLIGLSIGAHQMSMLAFFPIWAIVYYKHWPKVTAGTWIMMLVTGILAFIYIYKVVLTGVVGWAESSGIIMLIFVLALIGGTWYTLKENKTMGNLVMWSASLIFLGYTTYAFVMVRATQDPPMNQHSPTTFAGMHEYIGREQYGEAREFPRRNDDPAVKGDPLHAPTWDETKYKDDWDFFWKYQTDHMYLRYIRWNFVGRAYDRQDAPTDWTKTLGLPLFLGLFGLYWHFKRDPKRALSYLAAFIIMGLITTWFQNQQDAQPRERDYFYVGSFAIYAMWIGIGFTGLMEMLRVRFAKKQDLPLQQAGPTDREVIESPEDKTPVLRGDGPMGVLVGAFALTVLLIPINQLVGLTGMTLFGESFHQASKWGEYSRYHNNVPLEYAYNILQSCEPDAILFTAGDNDTFPLWCIQDLYGVRRDVRIVNLSLANMGWYVKKLKDDTPWGAKKVSLPSFTEQQLANPDETPQGIHMSIAAPTMVTVNVSAAAMQRFTGTAQPYSFQWKWVSQHPSPYDKSQYVYEIADQLVRDIVVNNINDRPIYFAVAVPPSYWTGLDQHAVYEGLAARIVPTTHPMVRGQFLEGDINEAAYTQLAYRLSPKIDSKPDRAMMMNSYRDPESNRSGLDEQYGTTTYLELYGRLANYYLNHGQMQEAHRALDTLVARVPPKLVDYDYNLLQLIGQLYQAAGDQNASKQFVKLAAEKLSKSAPEENQGDETSYLQGQVRRADLYMSAEMYDSARVIYSALRAQTEGGNQLFMDFRLAQIDAKVLEQKGQKQQALDKYNQILAKFSQLNQMGAGNELAAVAQERDRIAQQLGHIDSIKGRPAPGLPAVEDRTKTAVGDSANVNAAK